jgi:sugar phosphate isomerase/epimerase
MAEPAPIFSVSQSVLRGADMAGDLDRVLAAGETMVAPMGAAVRATGLEAAARLIRERGLAMSSYHAGLRLLDVDEAEAERQAAAAIREAAALGAPLVVVNPGGRGERSFAEADAAYIARLRRVSGLARELGVGLLFEPLHPILAPVGYMHSLRHAAEVAAAVDGCRVVVDTVHLYWDRQVFDDIKAHVGRIGVVQLGQLDGQALADKRWVRAPLPDGPVPMADLIRALHAAGFRGPYEHENLMPGELPADERVRIVRQEAQWFRDLW